MYPKNYCVFDFETSGLDPAKEKIIEIGALRVEQGKPVEQLSWLLNWPGLVLPDIVKQLTGIEEAQLQTFGNTPALAWYEFREFTKGLPMIGHNIIKFDIPFLIAMDKFVADKNASFKDVGLTKNCVDTAALFKAKKLGEAQRWNETLYEFSSRVLDTRVTGLKFNVGVACDELGVDRSKAIQHRAEGDVMLTNEIYKKICLGL